MSIQVHPDWWKKLFDEIYLLTDARSVCDQEITRREVNVICDLLPLSPEDKILDLCGGHGRHSLELCERGFDECTLVDFSECLIEHASKKAKQCNYPIQCVQADARQTGLPTETFDHVIIMGNSLGYIPAPDADKDILSEAHRTLRSGGWLLADVTNGQVVKNTFAPSAWHEIGEDIVVCRQRELHGQRIHAREMVISKQQGLIRDETYAVRLYEPDEFELLLTAAGFKNIRVHTDVSSQQAEGDYGFMNSRMFASGQK